MAVIQCCPISYDDTTEIIKSWIQDTRDIDFTKYGYNLGVDLNVDEVRAISSGVVLSIYNESKKLHGVAIQYDQNTVFRYMHLKSVLVNVGDAVPKGFRIGIADKYVHVEYLNHTAVKYQPPTRIGSVSYYKHDPTPYLDRTISLT